MAKEFANLSGVTTILEIPELPCIPMQGGHAHSSVHLAVINTFQCLGEADPSGTARALLDSVKHAMGEIEEYREGNGDWRDLGDRLPVLRGLVPRIFYVASYFSALPLSQSRNLGSLLEEIKKNKRDTLLEELGRLHRSAMTAVAQFKADSPPREDGTNDDLKGPAGKYLSARLYTGIAKTFKSKYPSPQFYVHLQLIFQPLFDCYIPKELQSQRIANQQTWSRARSRVSSLPMLNTLFTLKVLSEPSTPPWSSPTLRCSSLTSEVTRVTYT